MQIPQRLFPHLAGADHQHLLVVEAVENLPGKIADRDAGNAHPLFVDRRFLRHPLGDAQGGLKHFVRQRPGAIALLGQLIGLLHLGQNLRLAEHQAIETGRDGEQMPHGRLARLLEQVVEDRRQVEAVKFGQKFGHLLMARRRGVVGVGQAV